MRSIRSITKIIAVTAVTGLSAGGAAAALSTGGSDTASTGVQTTTSAAASTATAATTNSTSTTAAPSGGPGGGVSVSSVSTVDELNALIQAAYGDASLDLHRGHQPVESVLIDTLGITHEEMHTRMEAGQNLSAIAEDLDVGTDALVQALVESWSPAIDNLEEAGTISSDEADDYLAALEEAFTYRVSWDGSSATPTFSGLSA